MQRGNGGEDAARRRRQQHAPEIARRAHQFPHQQHIEHAVHKPVALQRGDPDQREPDQTGEDPGEQQQQPDRDRRQPPRVIRTQQLARDDHPQCRQQRAEIEMRHEMNQIARDRKEGRHDAEPGMAEEQQQGSCRRQQQQQPLRTQQPIQPPAARQQQQAAEQTRGDGAPRGQSQKTCGKRGHGDLSASWSRPRGCARPVRPADGRDRARQRRGFRKATRRRR